MNTAVQTTRGLNLIFLHSSLDDAGLTTEQFRVLAHISRRAGDGEAWASNSTMAKVCRVSENNVRESLKELERRRMVNRQERVGKTTVWTITPPKEWDLNQVPKIESKGRRPAHPPETTPPPNNTPTPLVNNTPPPPPNNTPRRISPEGNPLEGNPKAFSGYEIPLELNTPDFQTAWSDWLADRKERRKPVTSRGAKMQLSELSAIGSDRAVAAIRASIQNSWQGIYEPKVNGFQKPRLVPGDDEPF